MIKFIAAAIWVCAVAIGAVIYSFQTASAKIDAPEAPAMLGGLDYIKTDVVSVPLLRNGSVEGYFLTRLVYTAEPKELARLSLPADALITDQVYSYVYGNPQLDFSAHATLDLDAFRAGVRDSINQRIGAELIHDVLVEQVDFLTKDEIRDNTIRRKLQVNEPEPRAEKHSSEH